MTGRNVGLQATGTPLGVERTGRRSSSPTPPTGSHHDRAPTTGSAALIQARNPHRISPFNLVSRTSPGRIGRYLKGAETTAYYPVSVVTDGQGLNITVQGYLGGLNFGLIACRELVPDVDKLTGYLVDELDLLSS